MAPSKPAPRRTTAYNDMGFFSRLPRRSLAEICLDYFRDEIFPSPQDGKSDAMIYCEVVAESACEADRAFSAVPPTVLFGEFVAIRCELFGLAWLQRYGSDRVSEQTEFIRRYLKLIDCWETWTAGNDYNQTIGQSALVGSDGSSRGKGIISAILALRAGNSEKWKALGFEPSSVARAANRLGVEAAWKDLRTQVMLTDKLCERLEVRLNAKAKHQLTAVIFGFYKSSEAYLKAVRLSDDATDWSFFDEAEAATIEEYAVIDEDEDDDQLGMMSAALIALGAKDLESFTREAVKTFGESYRPLMPQLYELGQLIHKRRTGQ